MPSDLLNQIDFRTIITAVQIIYFIWILFADLQLIENSYFVIRTTFTFV